MSAWEKFLFFGNFFFVVAKKEKAVKAKGERDKRDEEIADVR